MKKIRLTPAEKKEMKTKIISECKKSRNVIVSLAIYYSIYSLSTAFKFICNLLSCARFIHISYHWNIFIKKTAMGFLFSLKHCKSILLYAIHRIFFMGSFKKMLWVEAFSVIAFMTNKKFTINVKSKKYTCTYSMDSKKMSVNPNSSISVINSSLPFPAIIFSNYPVFKKRFFDSINVGKRQFFFMLNRFKILLSSSPIMHITKSLGNINIDTSIDTTQPLLYNSAVFHSKTAYTLFRKAQGISLFPQFI